METTSFIYCVKCKKKTMTVNIETVKTINNRMRIKGNCVICQCKKSQFMKLPVSKKTGSGIGDILNNTIGKLGDLGIELHLPADKGEYVPNGSQRNREGYKGINELDRMAKLHDQFYNENSDTKSRNISDIALAHRAEEIASDPNIDETQRRDAKFVKTLMQNKARFGFGVLE